MSPESMINTSYDFEVFNYYETHNFSDREILALESQVIKGLDYLNAYINYSIALEADTPEGETNNGGSTNAVSNPNSNENKESNQSQADQANAERKVEENEEKTKEKTSSMWNKILEKIGKIINILSGAWNKLNHALGALAGDATVSFNEEAEAMFVYKLDRYQSEILEVLKYCASIAEIGMQILNMTSPGEKINELTEAANKAKEANDKFNSHDEEAKSYIQQKNGYKVTGTIFKKKIDIIKPHIDKLGNDFQSLEDKRNANALSDPDASKEITRCFNLLTVIITPLSIRIGKIYPILESMTGNAGNINSIKKQILDGTKKEQREGFPIIFIQNIQFPSTWHFDDNDHSDYVDEIRKKYNKSTLIVVNENIFKRMSAEGQRFMLEHEVGHAKEYDDGTLSGQADMKGEIRADMYAVKSTGYNPDQVQKIFNQAYDICKRGIVPKVDTIRLKRIFDERIKAIRENYSGENKEENKEEDKAAFLGMAAFLGDDYFDDLFLDF